MSRYLKQTALAVLLSAAPALAAADARLCEITWTEKWTDGVIDAEYDVRNDPITDLVEVQGRGFSGRSVTFLYDEEPYTLALNGGPVFLGAGSDWQSVYSLRSGPGNVVVLASHDIGFDDQGDLARVRFDRSVGELICNDDP